VVSPGADHVKSEGGNAGDRGIVGGETEGASVLTLCSRRTTVLPLVVDEPKSMATADADANKTPKINR
jgi:hypothetical protein